MAEFDHFREFADFLDGVGLPAEWSPYLHGPDRDPDIGDSHREPEAPVVTSSSRPGTRPSTPFSSWLPSAPAGNRITGTDPNEGKSPCGAIPGHLDPS